MTEEYMIPRRATLNSAGYDFYSPERFELVPGEVTYIDTGIDLKMIGGGSLDTTFGPNPDWFMFLAPRSSFGFKYGMMFVNIPPIIDRDFPDTIKVGITVRVPYTLEKGERFMQGVICPFGRFIGEIHPCKQRIGGIGSTGEQ